MPDKTSFSTIIKTKLFKPTVVADFVPRLRVNEILEQGADCKLTLVSAPAGYGKSLSVSSWLDSCGRIFSWVSLDEEMNYLPFFLQYILFTLRKKFPEMCPNSWALVHSSESQSPKMMSAEFVNELLEIDKHFVLVLDDYGFIHNSDVHEFINLILKVLPDNLQLVLITRRDPPFPLHSMRAQSDLVEVRQEDLQFTIPETVSFFKKSTTHDIDRISQEYLYGTVEGWIAGLRLVSLSLQNRDNMEGLLHDMKGDSRHIQDYLMNEVLSHQSLLIRDGLLKTSILNRFCTPLYTALCHPERHVEYGDEIDRKPFIRQLEESNLFCIGLDEQGTWFRYHHLFQQLLKRILESRYSQDNIAELHRKARGWFEENGMIEDALYHSFTINDSEYAGKLMVRHRHEFMNREQWGRLRHYMGRFPRELIENNPRLLIQDAWGLWNQMRIAEMAKVLDRVEKLLISQPGESVTSGEIRGEIHALRSVQYYLVPPCDRKQALDHARKALEGNPFRNASTRGLAVIMLAMSYQLTGNLTDAFKVILGELNQREAQQNTYHTRLLTTLCIIYWLETDLPYLKQTAEKLLELSNELSLQESRDIGQHYLGLFSYCRNELDDAEKYLKGPAGSSKVNIFNFAHSAFVYSLTNLAQDHQSSAIEMADSVVQYAFDTGNAPLHGLANAFKAELALRLGRLSDAENWAKNYDPEPFTTAHRFYVPQLTFVKVLIWQNSPQSKKRAADLLSRLNDHYQSIHNTYCLINILALQALLNNLQGDEVTADRKLAQALDMAAQGGHIRIFVDLGPDMERLLECQKNKSSASEYVQLLLSAFAENGSEKTTGTLPFSNPLTNREQEILELFARRLRNKEIAEKLCISENTVKRHATNIFRKLNVQNRRKAVEYAAFMGIIT